MTVIHNEKTSRTDGYRYRSPEQIRGARYAIAADWNSVMRDVSMIESTKTDEEFRDAEMRIRRENSSLLRLVVDEFCKRGRWEDPVDEAWFRRTCRHGYPGGRTFHTIDRKSWTPDTAS